MRHASAKQPAIEKCSSINLSRTWQVKPAPTRDPPHDSSSIATFDHDFSRVPVHVPVMIQPKLTINTPGDEYEQEADRISEQVIRTPDPRFEPASVREHHGQQNEPSAPEQMQTKRVKTSDTGKADVPPIVHEVLSSPGQPLDSSTRAFMEPRFGHDFSRVRVHANANAAEAASAIDARAFTAGRDIVFGVGKYAPDTQSGRQLLSHELTHVVQQRAGAQLTGAPGEMPHSKTLQRQEDPKKKKPATQAGLKFGIPQLTLGLDVNPARGAMERAHLQQILSTKSPPDAQNPEQHKQSLLDALERFDSWLMGDYKQSGYALSFYGKGTSIKQSTAASPAKDVVFLNEKPFDVTEIIEMMNVCLLSVSKKEEIFSTPKEYQEDLAQKLFEKKEQIDEIVEEYEKSRKKELAEEQRAARLLQLHQKIQGLRNQLAAIDLSKLKTDKAKVTRAEKKSESTKLKEVLPSEIKAGGDTAKVHTSATQTPTLSPGDQYSDLNDEFLTNMQGQWLLVHYNRSENMTSHKVILEKADYIKVDDSYASALIQYLKVPVKLRADLNIPPTAEWNQKKNFAESTIFKRFEFFYWNAPGSTKYKRFRLSGWGSYELSGEQDKATAHKHIPVFTKLPAGFVYQLNP